MKLRVPELLKEGDLVALLGPASPLSEANQADEAVSIVEALGLRVKAYPSVRARFDYLAGTDKQRASDLSKAFADPRIKGIVSIRGGYGSSRLLRMIDWKAVAKTPKLLLGFSDITSLHGALNSQCRLIGLHGPMASYFFKKDDAATIAFAALKKFLFEDWRGVSYRKLCGKHFKPLLIRKGTARGRIIGGNLSLFAGLCGTPYMPKPNGDILFIEEIHEKPYKLDRYVTQLINAGFMEKISGIVIGQIDDCVPSAPDVDDGITVMSRCLKPLGIPILGGIPIGHGRPAFPLPLGAEAELDVDNGDLKLL